ncbi:hypothetical protein TVAG_101030 [Trichomonas vaginalis G3]|uniref:FERM domain-containing protein n=1 Tax=Trichomonas vaginalis (strain ATCC PRA-98 / G3) TaxID=412133 RepID=A2DJI6_TRIV3|nr:Second domain of FERM family [Trichomonas vaginalis G3]EAY19386.1 hypothetical protein TVAG_101030 [Trichomonas vaginalis G3]KAI5493220.1 Second domain of FERM family [Trichomonas vaginalis G3]|eukprot:XP_001580372.1 hypothetical protein [Trichomonas vaginalis G3]
MSITLNTCTNIQGVDGKEFSYADNINGQQLLEQALTNLGIPPSGNYRALALRKGTTLTWIDPKKNIVHYHLKDKSNLYLLKEKQPISVETTSGAKKKLLVDITQKCSELVKFIADKFKIEHSNGYAIFTIDKEGVRHSTDLDLTLPQQSSEYENIFFTRRYFCFLKSHLDDKGGALFIYNDVKLHIFQSKLTVTHDQAVEMALLSLYVVANSTEEAKKNGAPSDIAPLFPPTCPPQQGDAQEIANKLNQQEPLTREAAVARYLTISHQLPNFGCEVFKTKFAPISEEKVQRQDGSIVIGPKSIAVHLPNGDEYMSAPWFRFISAKLHSSSVDIKYMERKGTEAEISLKVKKAFDVYTLISGYSSITKSLGAELLTDGFAKEDEAASTATIDPAIFKPYYTADESGQYAFFPGSTQEFKKFYGDIDDICGREPDSGRKLKSLNEALSKNEGDVLTRLRIIRVISDLLKVRGHNEFLDEIKAKKALASLSTMNIIPAQIDAMIEGINILIEHQKLLRAEIMTRLESTRKKKLTTWLDILTEHATKFQDISKKLKSCPASGSYLYNAKSQLIQLTADIAGLSSFISSVINLAPDNSYIVAIEQFILKLQKVTTPIIPDLPDNSIPHLVALYNANFYVGISIGLINKSLSEPYVANNNDLVNKITKSAEDYYNKYCQINTLRLDLNRRPFSMIFNNKMVENLNDLKHSIFSVKPHIDMVSEIAGVPIYSQGLNYSATMIDKAITAFEGIRISPYRIIPSKETVLQTVEMLEDISSKLTDASNKAGDVNQEFLFHLKDTETAMNNTALTLKVSQVSRATMSNISKVNEHTKWLLTNLQEVSRIIGNASIIHQINKLMQHCDNILALHTPSFDEYRDLMTQSKQIVYEQNHNDLIMEFEKMFMNPCYEDHLPSLYKLSTWVKDTSSYDPNPETIKCITQIMQFLDCAWQVPLDEKYTPQPLVLFPFFQGKDAMKMTSELTQEITDIKNYIKDLLKFELISKNETLAANINHWATYFETQSSMIDGLQQHENTLISRLKDILRKSSQIKLFAKNIILYVNDSKFLEAMNTFFSNIDLIITKLKQPQIGKSASAKFQEKVLPLLNQFEVQISRVLTGNTISDDRNLTEKLRTLKQMISQKMTDAQSNDINKQQSLSEELHQYILSILPECRQNQQLIELNAQMNTLKSGLSEFTNTGMMKLGQSGIISSSMFFTMTIDPQDISDIFNNYINNNVDVKQLQEIYSEITKEISALDQPSAYISNVLTNVNIKNKINETMRLIIENQDSEHQKSEQLKILTLYFAKEMTKKLLQLKEFVDQSNINMWSKKSKFYLTMLRNCLKTFDYEMLNNYVTFTSICMTYKSFKEIRNIIAILIAMDIDDEIKIYGEELMSIVDQFDISLKLYFFHHLELIKREMNQIQESNEKAKQIWEKMKSFDEYLTENSIYIQQRWIYLSELCQKFIEIENDLTDLANELQNPKLIKSLNAVMEINYILKYWTNAFDLTDDELRNSILSNLSLVKGQFKKIEQTLGDDVMSVPFVTATPLSYISRTLLLMSKFNQFNDYKEKIEKSYYSILKDNIQLFSNDDAYLADLELQEIIPQTNYNLSKLLEQVEEYNKPNYENLPTLKNKEVQRVVEVILTCVERHDFYKYAKEICDAITEKAKEIEEKDDEESLKKSLKLKKILVDIPKYVFVSLNDAKRDLIDYINMITEDESKIEEIYPKFIASLLKVMPSVPQETAEKLDIIPQNFVKSTEGLVKSTKLLKTYLSFLESDGEKIKSEITQSTVKIIEALDTENPQQIYKTMQEFIALNCVVNDRNEKSDLLTGIIENFSTFQAGIEETVSKNETNLDEKTKEGVLEMKRKFIIMITGATMDVAESIQKSSNIDSILDVRNNKNLSARTQIGQIDPSNIDARKHLLHVAANMQLLSQRGLEVTPQTPLTFYREYLSLFDQSIASFNTLLKEDAKEQKKGLRIFKRIVDNLGDLNDDLSLEISSSQLTNFEEIIRKFFRVSTEIEASIALINAAFATAKIPQSFSLVVTEQNPIFKSKIEELKIAAQNLTEKNTISEFNEGFNEMLVEAINVILKLVDIKHNIELMELTNLEQEITSKFENLASIALQMTDEVKLKYDPVNSARVPIKFKMPKLPDVDDSVQIQQVREEIIAAKSKLDSDKETLKKYFSQFNPDSTKFTDATLEFENDMSEFIQKIFVLSIITTNLQMQSYLTSVASRLSTCANNINHSTRNFLIAVPTWSANAEQDLSCIETELNVALSLLDAAVEFNEQHELNKDARKAKFLEALKPITEASQKAKDAIKAVESNQDEMFKTMATNMLNIALAGCHAVSTVLLKAKDSERTTSSPDEMCELAAKVAEAVLKAAAVVNTDGIVEITAPFADALDKFNTTITAKNAETESMSNTIKQVATGATSLEETIKKAIAKSKVTKKVSAASQKSPEERAKAQENLMRRLELESNVHRNRWWLEHNEKYLKSFD